MIIPAQQRAFWSGGDDWGVRFAPPEPGGYTYRILCTDREERSQEIETGTIRVTPYRGDNPMLRHGPLGISNSR
ncbi:MAG: DUF5060 domain-containing protein [Spirochaetia bacterium]